MKRAYLAILVVAVAGLGFFGYRFLFPSDERRIQKLLAGLAQAASFSPNQGNLARLAKASAVADHFSTDVHISLPGINPQVASIQGKDEVMQMMGSAQATLQKAEIQFYDILVEVEPGKEKAMAHFVALAKINQDKDPMVQELKTNLVKKDGQWRIQDVKAIQPLSSQVE